ncbi:HAMP domain-containing histidine kinase [Clostridium bornimense]|uniref:sensor histidine kinase n=1 Tax=Clostridium bornimense TaxID=1216932 RepID=UPI001C1099CD|nr:HAMP domain-containing sensor histidine kinase [Clostridium bornimense]MBU5316740.1 HAMP domain-containing histidine kinase [Clostridium bornimense]
MNLILLLIILILLVIIIGYKREIKNMSNQIRNSNGYLTPVRISSINKEIENLAMEINNLYKKNHESNLRVKENDENLKESIASMAHDLRTPLTSIMGYIQLIESDSVKDIDKNRYLKIIKKRTENLSNLINSFYDLSRIECNEYKMDLKLVDIKEIFCEVLALFYDNFLEANIEPKVVIDEKVSKVIADVESVNRIFSNLINNILKYNSGEVQFIVKDEEKFVVTTFINDAPDLNKEDVEKIFNRFYTGDSSRSDNSTGLGLSIVKALIEEMGHKIEASLEDGKLIINILWNK